jgi:hypothetical protein
MEALDTINSNFYSPDTAINSNLFDLNYVSLQITNFFNTVHDFLDFNLIGNIINAIFFVSAIFFIFIMCYSIIRILEVRKKEHEYLHYEIEEYAHKYSEHEKKHGEKNGSPQSMRWGSVLEHISSINPGDWKLAILEADSMLEDMLEQLGFVGENLGEKLKAVNMEKYPSLKTAWDVHIIRNKIAHEGLQFELQEQEAKRAIAVYKQIFTDFRYI